MSHQSDLIATDIDAYLKQHEQKELLRFLTCGSVDDGKSTLIGRLLHDTKMIYEDQLEAVRSDSTKHGTTGEKIDLALLVDGLQAEREQGITIDVAYRYFSTAKRKFIIADTPGHEQYTRNMVTGASTCDLAIILIDARYGVMTQTRRHSYIASLLGIRHIVVAINKMDLLGFDQNVFEKIKADYLAFAAGLNMKDIHFVPMSALEGDNVVNRSEKADWYKGQTLMEILETVPVTANNNYYDFRFPVQYVNRPNLDFRGFCGNVASGVVKAGDTIRVLPSDKTAVVKSIVTCDGELTEAFAGQAITITLDREIDVSRGDTLVLADDSNVKETSRIKSHLVWMTEKPCQPGTEYLFKFASKVVSGRVESVEHRIDVNTQEHTQVDNLQLNDIALVDVSLNQKVVADRYIDNRATGAFIVIDRLTNITVGGGMVAELLEDSAAASAGYSEFELELNALVRKHFPHWGALDLNR
jgi:sulfate adenylyltransferase subunit 1